MTNYNNMSKKNDKKDDLDLNDVSDITTYVDDVNNTDDIDNIKNTTVDSFNKIGTVIGCEKLRVRPTSNTDQEEIALIDEGSIVKISLEDSTEDFYKIRTDDGIEGYCMRSFISTFNVGE